MREKHPRPLPPASLPSPSCPTAHTPHTRDAVLCSGQVGSWRGARLFLLFLSVDPVRVAHTWERRLQRLRESVLVKWHFRFSG